MSPVLHHLILPLLLPFHLHVPPSSIPTSAMTVKKAWMDEEMMEKWIDNILIPWQNEKGPDVIPILILNAYRVHMMGNIVNWIQSLGIEVVHIPLGCTYLCQPVDVGINKSIKSRMHEKWENWMVTGEGIVNGLAKELTRQLVAEWAVEVYKNLPAQTL
jgi:hypothetical protein